MGVYNVTVTILEGQALSSIVDCRGGIVEAVQLVGDAWTAADLSFREAVHTEGPLGESVDSAGDPYAVPLAAGEVAHVPVAWGIGSGRLQLRSGSAASPVNQAAERMIRLRLRVL